jgi:nitroimidazol reductase NimA-like FMN-containing flavoprotein (pyridoxamine 5'-phosphate oxidase superfamily)
MVQPKITRPHFPKGYVDNPKSLLPWSHVVEKVTNAINYWFCSVHPNGRPHSIPKWAVMVGDKIYYDASPETRHAKNITDNPYVSLHLESGSDVVIIDGEVVELQKSSLELRKKIAKAYTDKYSELGYSPQPSYWENGGLFMITIRTAMAWTSFAEDPTKFVFES